MSPNSPRRQQQQTITTCCSDSSFLCSDWKQCTDSFSKRRLEEIYSRRWIDHHGFNLNHSRCFDSCKCDWIVFTGRLGTLIAGAIAGVVGAGLNYFVYKKSKQTPITVKTLQPVLPAPVAPPWLFLIEEQKTMLQMAVNLTLL